MPMRILLVEDNPIDVRATLRAAKSLVTPHSIHVVNDGDEAIDYVRSPNNHRPDLVLLDLNLPGRDGFDVLTILRAHDDLRRIPVVVLSTSTNDADVVGAYDRGANAYVNKPSSLDAWEATLTQIEAFWFGVARLPPP